MHVPQDYCADRCDRLVIASMFVVKFSWLEYVFAAGEMLGSFAGRHLCRKMGPVELGSRKQEDVFLIRNGLS